MKKFVYVLLCLLIMVSCGKKRALSYMPDVIASKIDTEKSSVEPDFSEIIHPDLFEVIKEFTVQDFSNKYLNINIVEVIISNGKDGHCYVVITPTYYYIIEPLNASEEDEFIESNYWYLFQPMNGYLIIDDKMVAFYIQGNCGDGFVDINKLLQGEPKGYMNNKDDKSGTWDYDPPRKIFKINREEMKLEEL